jgi:hypothetical protein
MEKQELECVPITNSSINYDKVTIFSYWLLPNKLMSMLKSN